MYLAPRDIQATKTQVNETQEVDRLPNIPKILSNRKIALYPLPNLNILHRHDQRS